MNDIIQKMFDEYPDEDELKDFDTFFIGDGSHSLMKKQSKKSNNSQLMGISSISDLMKKKQEMVEFSDHLKDDLKDFTPELSIDFSIEDYFCKIKREVFEVFGFLTLKSKSLSGRPFREEDLVVSRDDKYLLTYLKNAGISDFGVYNSIAQLKALSEMGFSEVRFSQVDCCPLCEAYDGTIYNIESAYSIVSSGNYLVHENCVCRFIPVIRKRSEYNNLVVIDIDEVYVGDTLVKNLPIEYKDDLYNLIPMLGYDEVTFASYKEHAENFDKDSDGGLIIEVGKNLHVCSDYLKDHSLLDYLKAWLIDNDSIEDDSVSIDEKIASGDIYYLNGSKVVEVDGRYFDIETKERIE